MKILCVIPSRLNSTRLPRKPLLPIQGKPMVQWTYENAYRSELFCDVVVATDSEEIANIIRAVGGHAVLTDTTIPTGSERVAKVAEQYGDVDVVVNLQGDEPFVKKNMLRSLITPYLNGDKPEMTTLAYPLKKEKFHDAGAVKVITDRQNNAIYFSRSPIPYFRSENETTVPVYHHIGLYAFTHSFLMHYRSLPQTPLEKIECLEQLRVLEHGYKIQVCFTDEKTLEVNTKEEYQQAQLFPVLES